MYDSEQKLFAFEIFSPEPPLPQKSKYSIIEASNHINEVKETCYIIMNK